MPLPSQEQVEPEPVILFTAEELSTIMPTRVEVVHPAMPRVELRKHEEITKVEPTWRRLAADKDSFEIVFNVFIAKPEDVG